MLTNRNAARACVDVDEAAAAPDGSVQVVASDGSLDRHGMIHVDSARSGAYAQAKRGIR